MDIYMKSELGRIEINIRDKTQYNAFKYEALCDDSIVFFNTTLFTIGSHRVTISPIPSSEAPPAEEEVAAKTTSSVYFHASGVYSDSTLVLNNGIYHMNGDYTGDIVVSSDALLYIKGRYEGAINTQDNGEWELVKGHVNNTADNTSLVIMHM